MKKIGIVMIIAVFGLVFSVFTANAEMAKEGSGDYRGGKSGTIEVLQLSEGQLQINWDETGVVVDAPENSPFVNASYRALGTTHSTDGKTKANGSIVFVCPNGDQIFGVIDTEGDLSAGPSKGGIVIIGGTGDCTGIEGKMEFMSRPAIKSAQKGTYQGIGIGKVSWKIP
jgi:hypothetical protein